MKNEEDEEHLVLIHRELGAVGDNAQMTQPRPPGLSPRKNPLKQVAEHWTGAPRSQEGWP